MAALLILLCASACTTTAPEPPNLSGTYTFSRSHYDGDLPPRYIPVLPLRSVQDPSLVAVTVGPDSLVIDYVDSRGTDCVSVTMLDDDAVSWDTDSITVSRRPGGVPIFPGLSYERVAMECRLDGDGRLVLEWTYREYGLMLFLVPFVDAFSGRAVLEPAR